MWWMWYILLLNVVLVVLVVGVIVSSSYSGDGSGISSKIRILKKIWICWNW